MYCRRNRYKRRLETVMANELPGNVRSHKNVYNWLVGYFENH